jgi:pimeloyl-ACP methyl ester carboxylesterase
LRVPGFTRWRLGAEAAYGAAAIAPERWRRLVTIGVPPLTLDERIFSDYDQLKRLFYVFFMKTRAGGAGDRRQ